VEVVRSIRTVTAKMLRPLKIVNYRKYKKCKNIALWTKSKVDDKKSSLFFAKKI